MKRKGGGSLASAALLVFLVFSSSFSAVNFNAEADSGIDSSTEHSRMDDFTIIVLPDTQHYSWSYPTIFDNQTKWIVDKIEELNIVFVSHEGDVVESDTWYQWRNANHSLSLLNGHVPWGVLPGNHDVDSDGVGFSSFDRFFGVERFAGKSWYGGGYYDSNTNNYELFSGGGDDYLMFHLQYDPSHDALEWANTVISSYPDRKVIVTTHEFLESSGYRTSIGNNIWNKFIQLHANQVFLVLCGDEHGYFRRLDFVNGNFVHQLLADYQDFENGGNGYLRILRFSPSQDKIYVSTYSPYLNRYMTDGNNQFSLYFDMTQAHYTLETNVVGSGSVDRSSVQDSYVFGSVVNLTATPAPGWSFSHWNGNLTNNANPTTITMYENNNITATFTQDHYTLDVSVVGSGTANINPTQDSYVYGTIVNLTATPAPGWSFSHWSEALSGSTNPTAFVMDGDKIVRLTFTAKQYNLPVKIIDAMLGYLMWNCCILFIMALDLLLGLLQIMLVFSNSKFLMVLL